MEEAHSEREMFYLTTHSTHFIYGYMASDIWLRTILIVRKETRCRHIGFSYRLTARVLLYAPSHRQDNTYHWLEREIAQWDHHEGSIRRPMSYISLRGRARERLRQTEVELRVPGPLQFSMDEFA